MTTQPTHVEDSPKVFTYPDQSSSLDSNQATGKVHKCQAKAKPLANSVKDKKDYAHARVHLNLLV